MATCNRSGFFLHCGFRSLAWGQPVVVENIVGVAGVLGTGFVAPSPADGPL